MITAFSNGRIVAGDRLLTGQSVLCENGVITALVADEAVPQDAKRVDLAGGILLPGYLDVQVNGGGGVLFNTAPNVEGLEAIAEAHAKFGTTGLMPTIISSDLATLANAIAAVDAAIAKGLPGILGIHIEGPFLSPKRRGIHNPPAFPELNDEAVAVLSSLKRGKTMVTLAPDAVPVAAVEKLVAAGVIVCIGHSDASYDQTVAVLKAGARGFTHLFNAMAPLTTREPGVVGAALDDRSAWCGIITDGHHVHPATARVAYACRGAEKLMLVTDAMPPVGSDENSFMLQGRLIRAENGLCLGPDGTLAGSATDMATVVEKAMAMFGETDAVKAAKLSSGNAAAFLGYKDRGVIAPGARADFVAVDDAFRLKQTFMAGANL
ncbi:N-acetylglucosamine-6-phosphate deacetylase [Rhizomicrobium palustre]|uniref:N-acetylglucosamine-6-phosphate deacetylase n=1 Tax=Rhizomicrobium palustre TaxID=189966 RepID=A0A846MWL8_9PROT|nr:N-acetylglucosamine-6-phosphate deacetylase [Rhizomicrobium palustre]NIK87430.1 N-acetylglucosamine-6-phosphate deacetylase [Rhizomicrobium palustre]